MPTQATTHRHGLTTADELVHAGSVVHDQSTMDTDPVKLAPAAVTSLRAQAGLMERSLTQDIREEREDLKEAAEQTLNVIVDLNLDGTIRWVSPSWVDVIGTQVEDLQGKPISDVVVSEPTTIFTDVVESMMGDDSRSQFVRFSVRLGSLSKLLEPEQAPQEDLDTPQGENATADASSQSGLEVGPNVDVQTEAETEVVHLEAQGIMVHDSGGESHVSCYDCQMQAVSRLTRDT